MLFGDITRLRDYETEKWRKVQDEFVFHKFNRHCGNIHLFQLAEQKT